MVHQGFPSPREPVVKRHRPAHITHKGPMTGSWIPVHSFPATLSFLLCANHTDLSQCQTHPVRHHHMTICVSNCTGSGLSSLVLHFMAAPTLLSLRLVPADFLRQAVICLLTGNPFHTKLEMGTLVKFLCEATLNLTSYFKETALSKEKLHQYSKINPVMGQLELFKHLD